MYFCKRKATIMALHLYYDNKKGLVKSNDHAIGCSIVEHDGKGYCCPLHEQILEIPERSITITVRTNLHYGSKSYMNASITMMKKPVLNFIDNSLFHSIKTIHAKPEDWNSLFDNIILVFNNYVNPFSLTFPILSTFFRESHTF